MNDNGGTSEAANGLGGHSALDFDPEDNDRSNGTDGDDDDGDDEQEEPFLTEEDDVDDGRNVGDGNRDVESDQEDLQNAFESMGLDVRQIWRDTPPTAFRPDGEATEGDDRDQESRPEFANAEARHGRQPYSKITRSVYYDGAAQVLGKGSTFIEKFTQDRLTQQRIDNDNIYYPWRDEKEWEFANVLSRMQCSLADKNALLDTAIVSNGTPYLHLCNHL